MRSASQMSSKACGSPRAQRGALAQAILDEALQCLGTPEVSMEQLCAVLLGTAHDRIARWVHAHPLGPGVPATLSNVTQAVDSFYDQEAQSHAPPTRSRPSSARPSRSRPPTARTDSHRSRTRPWSAAVSSRPNTARSAQRGGASRPPTAKTSFTSLTCDTGRSTGWTVRSTPRSDKIEASDSRFDYSRREATEARGRIDSQNLEKVRQQRALFHAQVASNRPELCTVGSRPSTARSQPSQGCPTSPRAAQPQGHHTSESRWLPDDPWDSLNTATACVSEIDEFEAGQDDVAMQGVAKELSEAAKAAESGVKLRRFWRKRGFPEEGNRTRPGRATRS